MHGQAGRACPVRQLRQTINNDFPNLEESRPASPSRVRNGTRLSPLPLGALVDRPWFNHLSPCPSGPIGSFRSRTCGPQEVSPGTLSSGTWTKCGCRNHPASDGHWNDSYEHWNRCALATLNAGAPGTKRSSAGRLQSRWRTSSESVCSLAMPTTSNAGGSLPLGLKVWPCRSAGRYQAYPRWKPSTETSSPIRRAPLRSRVPCQRSRFLGRFPPHRQNGLLAAVLLPIRARE